MKRLVSRHPFASFVILTYFITTSFAILTRLMLNGAIPATPIVPSLAPFGPSIAGLLLTGFIYGRSGLRDLFLRLNPARMGWRWPIACLLLPPILLLAAVAIHSLYGGSTPPSNWFTWPNFFTGAIWGAFLGAGLTEEFGWRGFALPHLQLRHSALVSGLLIGLVWALWHYPHRLLGLGPPIDASELISYVVAIIAMSVVYASVFNSTNGSLVAVMLLHGANNGSWKFVLKDLFPGIDLGGDVVENLLVGVLWIAVALILVIVFGPEDLSNKPRQVVEDISHATDPEAQKKAEQ